jgi:hopanoid biosynthesis associated protein HpnK
LLAALLFACACYYPHGLTRRRPELKELILNADDFGMTLGVNDAIVHAHQEGILTSATLMANGPAFEDAVRRALANPSLGVGCHLVLVGGQAIAPPEEISTLADPAGNLPRSLEALVARVSCGLVRLKHIERELLAQIQKIRRAGIEPSHLDTHKHTHAHPAVMEALGKVAHATGIARVRNPFERLRDSWKTTRGETGSYSIQLLSAVAARTVTLLFRAICKKYGLRSPDRFLGLAMTGNLGPRGLRQMIDIVSDGRTEIMLHPGLCDDDLASSGSRLQMQRQRELEGLLDPELKRVLGERDIRLISFRGLN